MDARRHRTCDGGRLDPRQQGRGHGHIDKIIELGKGRLRKFEHGSFDHVMAERKSLRFAENSHRGSSRVIRRRFDFVSKGGGNAT